ncbi:MAG: protease Do, partial [Bacteroidetes bacterium]
MKKSLPFLLLTLGLNFAFTFFLVQQFTRNLKGPEQEPSPVRQVNFVPEEQTPPPPATVHVVEMPDDFVNTSELVMPTVVNINTSTWGGRRFAGGSGVLVSPDGYIITNRHVIEGGSQIEVTLFDKRTFGARLVGTDPYTDLALLKIQGHGLPSIRFGDSDEVRVGEWVLAVGNPFNLASTVTAGIVSAKGRNINILQSTYSIESFIQTDAAVNPGNSGGALVNTRGELVGINTAIMSESGAYEGYSFAIPSNLVRKVVEDLREFGVVKRAVLGVSIMDVDDHIAEELKLPSVAGVYIRQVNAGSGAEEAG